MKMLIEYKNIKRVLTGDILHFLDDLLDYMRKISFFKIASLRSNSKLIK